MTETLFIWFLVTHGLLHLAIWLPLPPADADRPPPFHPEQSALLTAAAVRPATARRTSVMLAACAAAAYVAAAIAVMMDAEVQVAVLVVAVFVGLLLKALFFHRWLLVGALLDVLVLTSALVDWPVTVS